MTKDDIANALDEIGTLLALKGENDFKCRAYHAASRTISQLEEDVNKLIAAKRLGSVRGIGEALVEKITTLATTGKLPYLEELRASIPPGLFDILRLPGVGPKKVKALHDALGIDSLAKLKTACEAGEVAKLKGFGEKTAEKMLAGINFLDTVGNRVRFDKGFALGEQLLDRIRTFPGVIRAELCGSLRRRRDTVKDIDIVVSTEPANAAAIMEAFVKLPEVMQVIGQGPTKSSIVAELSLGQSKVVLNADLRVVTDEQFPVAVLHFTGSKEHNIRLRQRAIERGYSLNEYALTGGPKSFADEAAIYKALDLVWVPPELREDTGEIEAAEKNELPELVEVKDIRGVFHNHTTESDGTATLEEMAAAAQELGLEYLGIADHSLSLTIANGLSPTRVKRQWAAIDTLNKKLKGLTIFKGSEVDILEDGSLDFNDELLAGFDYVVASVHTLFALSEEAQTARVCKALSHPAVTMLGHATGRLLLRREGYKLDLDKVLEAAAAHGKMIEINAQPDRLDLDWKYVKRAKALGIPLVINPDAHSTDGLALYPYGVNVARRGWLTKAEVFNTRSAAEVTKELVRRKSVS
ncbi:DNA polymerase/3'-5' exonuclease PolX [Limnoglobus roseus]|uniref:DNA polymerase beta n=1 Tax=Limnoglobus roseus TaxID=2598579 RepID=A0A5C1A711_9BACT|nr:DNA polymerase/3'-5' exonuclease PolX [Limnoglobus roseus]QEL14500.1 DNA polymerase/3'-5' exonuclease PolX [Limnoglobus roseus]